MHVTQTRCSGQEINALAVKQDQIRHAMQGSFAFTLRCWETTPVGKNQHQGTGKEHCIRTRKLANTPHLIELHCSWKAQQR